MRLLVLATLLFSGLTFSNVTFAHDGLNAVIGDVSFVEAFGREPTSADAETLRIETHLRWVSRELRTRTTEMDGEPAAHRLAHLEELDRYIDAGRFPRNTDVPGRRPRFVDDRGHLCAVGHLIAASGHPDLVDAIHAQFEYEYLADMQSAQLAAWVRGSGFTVEELAMIQPTYRRPPPSRPNVVVLPPTTTAETLAAQIPDELRSCARSSKPDRLTQIEVRVTLLPISDAERARQMLIGSARPERVRIRARTTPRNTALERCVQRRVAPYRAAYIEQRVEAAVSLTIDPTGEVLPLVEVAPTRTLRRTLRRSRRSFRRCLIAAAGPVLIIVRVNAQGAFAFVEMRKTRPGTRRERTAYREGYREVRACLDEAIASLPATPLGRELTDGVVVRP